MDNFYETINRRPRIDVVQDPTEETHWKGQFESSNDITLYSWRNDWLKNAKDNLEHFKYFNRDHSVKVFYNELIDRPIILVGAGPSLEKNIQYLKLAKDMGIPIMATHHALMYMAKNLGVKPDYVVVLDAGKIWDDYFAFDSIDCSDVPLLVDQTCNCDHLKQWKGPVYFFRSSWPDGSSISKLMRMEMDRIIKIEGGGSIIETGGHAMGACVSLARGVMTSNTILLIGADYCFNEQQKFYPFDHKIDQEVDGKDFGQPGKILPAAPPAQGIILDIFGNQVQTNGAYLGFKNVMDLGIKANIMNAWQTGGDLEIINATEGGSLGALVGGNSKFMSYLRLEDAIYYATNKRRIKEEKG